jgi:hypothetical protein
LNGSVIVEVVNRVVRVVSDPAGGLIGADVMGRVHRFDRDLRLRQSSQVVRNGQPLYALLIADDWIVGKDRIGNIARWRLDTLDLIDYLDAHDARMAAGDLPDEEPSIAVSRGLACVDNLVYVNNGFMQLVVLELDTFAVKRIVPSPTGVVPIEWVCVENPKVQAISDKQGRLFLGRLDNLDFPTVVQIDERSNLHRVRYDPRHDRFWVTQDSGLGANARVANGVVTVDPSGAVGESLLFAQDDVECLDFSPDFGRAVAGGFDGVLHFFDNTGPDLRIDRTLAGFSHQISDVVWTPDGSLFVLTHDGNLARVDEQAREHARAPFRRQCVWDIQPSPEDEDTYYLATDDGTAVVTLDRDQPTGPAVRECRVVVSGRGFTRRLVPVERGWVAISRDSFVTRSTLDGEIAWQVPLPGLLHTLACSPDRTRIMVAGNEGGFELDARSGDRVRTVSIGDAALWATTYLPTGEVVLGTPAGEICVFGPGRDTPQWTVDFGDYPKRMWCHEKSLFVTGGGGVKEFHQDGSGLVRHWFESMSNTCDNAVVLGDRVFVITYDGQIGLFERQSGELIGVLENLPEIPKGLALVKDRAGEPYLLIGGRGGFVGTYRIDTAADTVVKVRDFVVPRQSSGVAHPGLCVSAGTSEDPAA